MYRTKITKKENFKFKLKYKLLKLIAGKEVFIINTDYNYTSGTILELSNCLILNSNINVNRQNTEPGDEYIILHNTFYNPEGQLAIEIK